MLEISDSPEVVTESVSVAGAASIEGMECAGGVLVLVVEVGVDCCCSCCCCPGARRLAGSLETTSLNRSPEVSAA